MRITVICLLAFLSDLLFGDPVWLYHPVRMIGLLITRLEKILRKAAGESVKRLMLAGGILWILVCNITVGTVMLLLYLAEKVHPLLPFVLEAFWCYQLLAAASLRKESMKVFARLEAGDLPGARQAVSMIVGRDTEELTEEGVTKAAVETIAENTSDGVIAPLFYMMIGGAPLAFLYKAVNTMDSMIGYKNERYLYFGRAAARLDDVFNYIPARISALLMIAAAGLLRFDAKNAWRIYQRDGRNHSSPNAGQTEAVCAGALRVELAGNAYYFGKLYEKPTIGDPLRDVCPGDIKGTCILMYASSLLMLFLGVGIRMICRM
ncbi:adenosylcobinamide-phosphate synthase CbiB [Lachnospiraceae bacterium 62-26]